MNPYSLVLTEEAAYLEATISEMNFWQNTSATIIAIKHKEELLVSPGPYAKISLNDTLYFVGHDESTLQRVQNFFYLKQKVTTYLAVNSHFLFIISIFHKTHYKT